MTDLYEAGDINQTDGGDGRRRVDDERSTRSTTSTRGTSGRRADGGTPLAVLTYLARSLSNDPDAVVIDTEERRGGAAPEPPRGPRRHGPGHRAPGPDGPGHPHVGQRGGRQGRRPGQRGHRRRLSLLKVGRVTKAHGLRGEVVVQLWTDQDTAAEPRARSLASARGTLQRRGVEAASAATASSSSSRRWPTASAAERLRGVELEAEPHRCPRHAVGARAGRRRGAGRRRHRAGPGRGGRGQSGQRPAGARVGRADPRALRHPARRRRRARSRSTSPTGCSSCETGVVRPGL